MTTKDILEEHFTKDTVEEKYTSNKKWLGVSSGDDKKLIIEKDIERNTMIIYWKDNRGFETTIFEGKLLHTNDEISTLLGWLEINKSLKWNK